MVEETLRASQEVVGVLGETVVEAEGPREVEEDQLISSGIFPKLISLYKSKLSILTFLL